VGDSTLVAAGIRLYGHLVELVSKHG